MTLEEQCDQLEEDNRQLQEWYHQQELEHQRWLIQNSNQTPNGGQTTTEEDAA